MSNPLAVITARDLGSVSVGRMAEEAPGLTVAGVLPPVVGTGTVGAELPWVLVVGMGTDLGRERGPVHARPDLGRMGGCFFRRPRPW